MAAPQRRELPAYRPRDDDNLHDDPIHRHRSNDGKPVTVPGLTTRFQRGDQGTL